MILSNIDESVKGVCDNSVDVTLYQNEEGKVDDLVSPLSLVRTEQELKSTFHPMILQSIPKTKQQQTSMGNRLIYLVKT